MKITQNRKSPGCDLDECTRNNWPDELIVAGCSFQLPPPSRPCALGKEYNQLPEKATSPFRTKWIVPLILPVIIDTPAISNKNHKQFLSPYGLDYALTDPFLQEARSDAKLQLFGKSEENVLFAEGIKTYLERSGHVLDLLHNVERLVVSEEMLPL